MKIKTTVNISKCCQVKLKTSYDFIYKFDG